MNFDAFIEDAWNDAHDQAHQVARRISQGVDHYDQSQQVCELAELVSHVYGEKLGLWDEGFEILQKLCSRSPESQSAKRALCALQIASGRSSRIVELSLSDQVRAQAMACLSLLVHGSVTRASALFHHALFLVDQGLKENDPAVRALANTSHNLATRLEKSSERSTEENELMIKASDASLKYWKILGAKVQEQRAHYLMAKCFLAIGAIESSRSHAEICLKMCAKSTDEEHFQEELFWAIEINALVAHAVKDIDSLMKHSLQLSELSTRIADPLLATIYREALSNLKLLKESLHN
jgi:hypothetical protein